MCIRTLLDGVESLILGDLKLGVGPSWDFNNHYIVSRALLSGGGNILLRTVLDSSAKRGISLNVSLR
jgi:hypothetical protein